jgi:predicted nucleic acid-binding protein
LKLPAASCRESSILKVVLFILIARKPRSKLGECARSWIHPDEHISEKAISLLEIHAGPDGLRTIDALMAATALRKDDTLATANHKHFKKIAGLDIRKFAP